MDCFEGDKNMEGGSCEVREVSRKGLWGGKEKASGMNRKLNKTAIGKERKSQNSQESSRKENPPTSKKKVKGVSRNLGRGPATTGTSMSRRSDLAEKRAGTTRYHVY